MWDLVKIIIGPIATCILAAMTGLIANMRKKQKAQELKQEAFERGLKGLLHDRIHERYYECAEKGYADVQDRENMESLYVPYHELGGNGTGTALYTKMQELPTEAPASNKLPVNPAESVNL